MAGRNALLFSASIRQIPILRAVKPSLKILAYDQPGGSQKLAVDYSYLDKRTDWWVRDAKGSRLHETRGYGPYVSWLLNISQTAYRNYETTMLANLLSSNDYDGVFLDVSHPTWVKYNDWYDVYDQLSSPPPDVIDGWPDWMLAFHRELKAMRGSDISIFNGWPNNPSRYEEYKYWYDETLAASDGAQFDGFCYDRDQPWPLKGWEFQLASISQIISKQKIVLLKTPLHFKEDDPDFHQVQRFCFGTYLLVADGQYAMYRNSNENDEVLWNDRLYSAPVGAPAGAFYRVGEVYRRDFTNGTVLVNPSASTQLVDLGYTSYRLNGRDVSKLYVRSMNSVVLLKTPTP